MGDVNYKWLDHNEVLPWLIENKLVKIDGWFERCLRQLAYFKTLQQNWDSYGAHPIKEEIIAVVLNVLFVLSRHPNISKPHVIPTVRGGIQFEWESDGDFYLEMEFINTHKIRYYWDKPGSCQENTLLIGESFDYIIKLLTTNS